MTDRLDEFARLIDNESFEMELLEQDVKTIEERKIGRIESRFVKNLQIQRAVPHVEITYRSTSKVKEAYGEILAIEDGELKSEQAIAGYEYLTDGFELQLSKSTLRNHGGTTSPEDLLTALYSLGYGLRSVMARRLGVNPIEIQCEPHLFPEQIRLLIYDNESGGAGLSYPIFQDIEEVMDETALQLQSCTCPDYCENCLLLPRTPTFLLENDLLNRELGAVLLEHR